MSKARHNAVIVNYGMGNLFSIEKVVRYLGSNAVISSDPSVIALAKRLILPGVGAFGDGMLNLKRCGLIEVIKEFANSGRPLLGICLGMQLLMSEGEEFGLHSGLDLVSGRVKRLAESLPGESAYKIPHVGWNRLNFPLSSTKDGSLKNQVYLWGGTILQDIPEGVFTYFVHSYVAVPALKNIILAETVYGNNSFCSVLGQDNIFGCQFHPEISGETGLKIMRNFLFL